MMITFQKNNYLHFSSKNTYYSLDLPTIINNTKIDTKTKRSADTQRARKEGGIKDLLR